MVTEIPRIKMSGRNQERLELIKREKRNLYLLVAVKIFQQKGFNATTVKDITDAAGTSIGNFYRYFENKEQIFLELIDQFHKLLFEPIHELNSYEIPPLAIVKKVFRNSLNLLREQKAIALLYIEQMGGISKEYQILHDKLEEEYIAEIEKILIRGYKLINIEDLHPHITAIGWVASILRTFHWWAKTNFAMNADDFVDKLTNFLLFGAVTTAREYPTL